MRGLILVDQPPVHLRPGPGYAEFWSGVVYQGVPLLNFMRREALEGIERESTMIYFSPELPRLNIPVKFFAGTDREARIESNVTAQDVENYRRSLPVVEIVEFSKSGISYPTTSRKSI